MGDENAEPTLSEEELVDCVPVAQAGSPAEAAFVVAILERAGIPAIREGESLASFGTAFVSQRICVPRVLKERAESELATERQRAQQTGMDDAFSEDAIAERTHDETDPVMTEVLKLREDSNDRDERLSAFVAEWLTDNMPSVRMFQYLAAAGLSRTDAESLIAKVREERHDLLDAAMSRRVKVGAVLVVSGVIVGLTLWLISDFFLAAGVCLIVAGLAIGVPAFNRPPRSNEDANS